MTYFIIVAVALLLVMVGLLYIFSTQEKIQVTTSGSPIPALPAIQNFVESCLDVVGTKAIYNFAYQGGYTNPKGDESLGESGDGRREHHYSRDTILPYAANRDVLSLRPLSEIEQSLSRLVLVKLGSCLDFSAFERQGLKVEKPDIDFALLGFDNSRMRVPYSSEPVSSRATIGDEDVTLEVNYPIRISSAQGQAIITRAVRSIPLRLGLLHQITGAVLADASRYNPYDLVQHCKKFGARDGRVNIYLDRNPTFLDHALAVVDAAPLDSGFAPLRFQVGMLNINMTGVCTG